VHACAPPLTQEWRKASLTDEFMGFSRGLARTSLEAVVVDQFDNEQKLMSVLRKQLLLLLKTSSNLRRCRRIRCRIYRSLQLLLLLLKRARGPGQNFVTVK
jgi:hypothetical protein